MSGKGKVGSSNKSPTKVERGGKLTQYLVKQDPSVKEFNLDGEGFKTFDKNKEEEKAGEDKKEQINHIQYKMGSQYLVEANKLAQYMESPNKANIGKSHMTFESKKTQPSSSFKAKKAKNEQMGKNYRLGLSPRVESKYKEGDYLRGNRGSQEKKNEQPKS
mmetsp:Transcript_18129/g.17277  ORF Transcript_18129/g.17277 Transcript_18129/m.17277 type:complete len:161 (+) Transcript_18129:1542-2024(+)|eukprot:CAMPEP_0170567666 /NCGR_PEP_ID=MMETSP0211-20121228/80626_1 /TAXON_ID=311385 /ORGANISM="Pseudokeronopsis sp., Strain OXSARD2" /LENGTH=160 /DNA_ID=CAMNT_0010889187 /DNA_START=1554 /DNA_END=2036 /DNA_ORIENTATION=+